MTHSDVAFYAIIVIGILVLIYLFWRRSQTLTVQSFTQVVAPQQQVMHNANFDIEHAKTKHEITDVRQQLTNWINQELTPEVQASIRQTINSKISYINKKIQQLATWANSNQTLKSANMDSLVSELNSEISMINNTFSRYGIDKISMLK